jgi:urease accessory protein
MKGRADEMSIINTNGLPHPNPSPEGEALFWRRHGTLQAPPLQGRGWGGAYPMSLRNIGKRGLQLALLTIATPALAHPGHGPASGLTAGLLHPLTGMDHLLAMLMVGLWSGFAFPKRAWLCPAAFVVFMLAGFVFGASGGRLPIAEMLIIASLVVLGLALTFEAKAPIAAALPLIALFAIGHGFAHGAEMATGESGIAFAAGFVTTTIALHLAGIGLSRAAMRMQARRIGQAVGLAATVAAATMLWSS